MSEARAVSELKIDGASIAAGAITLCVAVAAAIGLGALKGEGPLGEIVETLKNVVYAVLIPVFELCRRAFASRGPARAPGVGPAPLSYGYGAIYTALVLLATTQGLAWLAARGAGATCHALLAGQQNAEWAKTCVAAAFQAQMGTTAVAVMGMIALTAGWQWHKRRIDSLVLALVLCALIMMLGHSLDYIAAVAMHGVKTVQMLFSVQSHAEYFLAIAQSWVALLLLLPVGYGIRALVGRFITLES